jgi:hypothetical protein
MEDGMVLPPMKPGLGIELTDKIKERYPFIPGSGEFNDVPGKIQLDYDNRTFDKLREMKKAGRDIWYEG